MFCFDQEDTPPKAGKWVQDLLCNTVFAPARVRVAAKRLLSDIPGLKDSGSHVSQVQESSLTEVCSTV